MILNNKISRIIGFLFESPWGNKPAANNNEFDKFLKKGQQHFNNLLNNNANRSFIVIAIVLVLLWLASGFYNIEQEEQAVVLRFGKFTQVTTPGLNYHFPSPIEKIIIRKVTRAEKEEIGFRSASGSESFNSQRSVQRNVPEESLMLTGDENIIDINFTVQWNIKDIKDFVFNVKGPKETVKSAAESAMREVIGNMPVAANTEDRAMIEMSAKKLLQEMLDSYKVGIQISSFSIQKLDPPAEVIDAFRDVQTARADKEREINQAQAYQNDIIPRARGEASRIIQDAEAYKQEVVAIATGEVSRFDAIRTQYQLAKDVTKKRLYLEMMEQILPNIEKIIIDKDMGKNVMSYLPLPQLNK